MYLNYVKDGPQIFLQNDIKLPSISYFVLELENFSLEILISVSRFVRRRNEVWRKMIDEGEPNRDVCF